MLHFGSLLPSCVRAILWSVINTNYMECYNIARRAAQSNSVYVSVLKIPIVHTDSVSKSLRQNFSRERPLLAPLSVFHVGFDAQFHQLCYKTIKLLVHAFSCALLSYGARGKFREHSRS